MKSSEPIIMIDHFKRLAQANGFVAVAEQHPDGASWKARLNCGAFQKTVLVCDTPREDFLRAGVEIPLLDSVYLRLFRSTELSYPLLHSIHVSAKHPPATYSSESVLAHDFSVALASLSSITKPGDIAPWFARRDKRLIVSTHWHQARLYWIALCYLGRGEQAALDAIHQELNPPMKFGFHAAAKWAFELAIARQAVERERAMLERALHRVPTLATILPGYDREAFAFDDIIVQR
jgi:hypothetical protein